MNVFPAHIYVNKATGKETIHTAQAHSRACAHRAQSCLQSIGLGTLAYLAGLLHDLGKFTARFRRYILAAAHGEPVHRGSVNHTFAAVRYLLQRYHGSGHIESMDALAAELLAYACGAHHALFDCTDVHGNNGFDHRLQMNDGDYEEACGNFNRLCATDEEIDTLFRQAVKELEAFAGRIPECDQTQLDFYTGCIARLLLSAVIEGDRQDTADFMDGRAEKSMTVDWANGLHALETSLGELPAGPLDDVRQYISEECKSQGASGGGLYRLSVPTGSGKTLSVLRFALMQCLHCGKKRILYTAPLLTIIDQNVSAIRGALGATIPVLEHHSNVIDPTLKDDELDERELLCESWRAPIICTTLMQLLNVLFSARTTCVRRFQALCESVIVLDEVQSVPTHMLSQFNLMLNFLTEACGATVVLCSATQPATDRMRYALLPAREMVCENTALFAKFRRTQICDMGDMLKLEQIAQWSKAQLDEVDSLLVVCNTRREAAALFGMLRVMRAPCLHLSAGMCTAHRKRRLQRIAHLTKGKKLICVSTQVIEAGVDASFQRAARMMAGMDSVVQTVGRCNRHAESPDALGKVLLVDCEGEKLPYAMRIIRDGQMATRTLLSRFRKNPAGYGDRLDSSMAIRAYYQQLYAGFKEDGMDYPIKELSTTMMELLSMHPFVREEDGERYHLHQAFKEAGARFQVLGEDTVDLLVPFGDGRKIIEAFRHPCDHPRKLLRRARPFIISVYREQMEVLQRLGAIEVLCEGVLDILALKPGYYDSLLGLVIPQDNERKGE